MLSGTTFEFERCFCISETQNLKFQNRLTQQQIFKMIKGKKGNKKKVFLATEYELTIICT